MNDIKFNCPGCGQRLAGDERYAGQQITCPTCGKTVVVPAAAAAPGVAVGGGVPPIPGGRPQPAPLLPPKRCGLAIASLVCSIGSFIIIPLGFIPGIICGHMAKKRIAATPGLQGGGLAKAGLIIGYIGLGVTVLAVLAVAAFFVFFGTRVRQTISTVQLEPSAMKTQPQAGTPAEKETTNTKPDGSGWTMKLAGVEIPSGPVMGRIQGQPFKMEKVALENGWLKLLEGTDFFADREMDVVLFENDSAKLSGRTFTVPNEESGITPHIWMKWKEAGEHVPKQRSFTDHYAMRLEFGQLSKGKLPGKIYLCVPDTEKSFVVGAFEVQIKQKKSSKGAPPAQRQ